MISWLTIVRLWRRRTSYPKPFANGRRHARLFAVSGETFKYTIMMVKRRVLRNDKRKGKTLTVMMKMISSRTRTVEKRRALPVTR